MNNQPKTFDITGRPDFDAEQKPSFDADSNVTLPYLQFNRASIMPKVPGMMAPGVVPPAATVAPQQEEEEEEVNSEDELKEHLAALFANTDLSEEFVEKAKTIFVAAVNEKVEEAARYLVTHYNQQYSNALSGTVSELSEKVDDYLTYVVEEWVNENKLQVERGIKVELAENFMFGLKKLFETNFIDVPNEKYDVLDELYTKIEEQSNYANNIMNENIKLKKNLVESQIINVFAQETHGLAATQVEKLASLAEGLEYDTPEQFRHKLTILKESYFSAPKQLTAQPSIGQQNKIVDILDTVTEPEMIMEGTMDVYKKALSRHLKK